MYGNATDTSGETAKQAGEPLKRLSMQPMLRAMLILRRLPLPRNADSKVITAAESPDPKATVTSEKLHYTANPNMGTWILRCAS